MRIILLALFVCLGPATAYGAAPGQAPASGWTQEYAQSTATPDQMLRQGLDRLIGYLIGAGNPSPDALRTFLSQEISPYFDFVYMAQWAAGPLYRRLTSDQHLRMAQKLETMFLDALARNLGTYARPLPQIQIFPARAGPSGNEATVDVRVITDAGGLVHLQFRCYWGGGGWRIYDVSANGASAVAFYRGYFTTLIRRYGPEAALR
jgi:phospholipid transport system substrate-binding protein